MLLCLSEWQQTMNKKIPGRFYVCRTIAKQTSLFKHSRIGWVNNTVFRWKCRQLQTFVRLKFEPFRGHCTSLHHKQWISRAFKRNPIYIQMSWCGTNEVLLQHPRLNKWTSHFLAILSLKWALGTSFSSKVMHQTSECWLKNYILSRREFVQLGCLCSWKVNGKSNVS